MKEDTVYSCILERTVDTKIGSWLNYIFSDDIVLMENNIAGLSKSMEDLHKTGAAIRLQINCDKKGNELRAW
jgi:hypothetical protein